MVLRLNVNPINKAEESKMCISMKLKATEGEIRLEKAYDNVFISLTDIATATNRKIYNWLKLEDTEKLIDNAEVLANKPVIKRNAWGSKEEKGTWATKEIALEFADWCDLYAQDWKELRLTAYLLKEVRDDEGNQ